MMAVRRPLPHPAPERLPPRTCSTNRFGLVELSWRACKSKAPRDDRFSAKRSRDLSFLCLFLLHFSLFLSGAISPLQLSSRMPQDAVDNYTYDVLRRPSMRVLETDEKVAL
jgi:hypothetical protein